MTLFNTRSMGMQKVGFIGLDQASLEEIIFKLAGHMFLQNVKYHFLWPQVVNIGNILT